VTDVEAFGLLRTTLPDVVDDVIAKGIGQEHTRTAAADLAAKLRKAPDLDAAMILDEQLEQLTLTDPPFHEAVLHGTQPIRDKAEAESPTGQVRQAAKDFAAATSAGASVAKDIGTIALVGLGLWALAQGAKLTSTLKRGGAI
jgi:hypothetical protein